MHLSGVAGNVDLTNNKFLRDNIPKEYEKISSNEGHVDLNKCYWNGDDVQ